MTKNYTFNSLPLSLKRQKLINDDSLLLNPVENIPFKNTFSSYDFLHGYYISDKLKTLEEQKNSIIQFSGRNRSTYDINLIYKTWANILSAGKLSMRLLSGLHAHIILFMGLGNIGDKVLLLPEKAGGHFATKRILERLGYEVIDLIIDFKNKCIDIDKSKKLIEQCEPKFIFIDRSEGLFYEDFSELVRYKNIYSIFDASQYLSHIIAGDYKTPFDMGFNLIISTIHKNYPGPQKAIVFTKENDENWNKVLNSMSSYVSSQHSFNTYSAGLSLLHIDEIKSQSKIMLENAKALAYALKEKGLPIIQLKDKKPSTQHIWININNKEKAFIFYKNMEKMRLLVNYRLLPYDLGFGIRIGTAAATREGLRVEHTEELAKFIAMIYYGNTTLKLKHSLRNFINHIKKEPCDV